MSTTSPNCERSFCVKWGWNGTVLTSRTYISCDMYVPCTAVLAQVEFATLSPSGISAIKAYSLGTYPVPFSANE